MTQPNPALKPFLGFFRPFIYTLALCFTFSTALVIASSDDPTENMSPAMLEYLNLQTETETDTTTQRSTQTIYESIGPQELIDLLTHEGYEVVSINGMVLYFRLANEHAALIADEGGITLQFYVFNSAAAIHMNEINSWNKNVHLSRTYIDKDGDVVLEVDFNLTGGVTQNNIIEFLRRCESLYAMWRTELIGY